VRNCELVDAKGVESLGDLDGGSDWVRDVQSDYLAALVNKGVAGFRVDAAKHMWPADLAAIAQRVTETSSRTPYYYSEVIDLGTEPITGEEYVGLGGNGDVSEFQFGARLGAIFKGDGVLASVLEGGGLGKDAGWLHTDDAVVFTSNHDNQRGHGAGGAVVTFEDGALNDLANVFMLAWPYGYPQLMSSYQFDDTDAGPPATPVYVGPTDTTPACSSSGWVCEHRRPALANMVGFRNATNGSFWVSHPWTNGGDQLAFGRSNRGYVVINAEGSPLTRTFKTGLAAGTYCDVITGKLAFNKASCTGGSIVVAHDGTFTTTVPPMSAVAVHAGQLVGGDKKGP
jgi:alpha-amylase